MSVRLGDVDEVVPRACARGVGQRHGGLAAVALVGAGQHAAADLAAPDLDGVGALAVGIEGGDPQVHRRPGREDVAHDVAVVGGAENQLQVGILGGEKVARLVGVHQVGPGEHRRQRVGDEVDRPSGHGHAVIVAVGILLGRGGHVEALVQGGHPAGEIVGAADVGVVAVDGGRERQAAPDGDALHRGVGVGVVGETVEVAAVGVAQDTQRTGGGRVLHRAGVEGEVGVPLRHVDVEVAVAAGAALGGGPGAGGAGVPAEQLGAFDDDHVPLVGVRQHAELLAPQGDEGAVHRGGSGGGQAVGVALLHLGLGQGRVAGGDRLLEEVVVVGDDPVVHPGRVAGVVVDLVRAEGAGTVRVAGCAIAGVLSAVGVIGVAVGGAVVKVVAETARQRRVLLEGTGASHTAFTVVGGTLLIQPVIDHHAAGGGERLLDVGLRFDIVIAGGHAGDRRPLGQLEPVRDESRLERITVLAGRDQIPLGVAAVPVELGVRGALVVEPDRAPGVADHLLGSARSRDPQPPERPAEVAVTRRVGVAQDGEQPYLAEPAGVERRELEGVRADVGGELVVPVDRRLGGGHGRQDHQHEARSQAVTGSGQKMQTGRWNHALTPRQG